MAEKCLYSALARYNQQIQNSYSDNWGSLLNFLNSNDTHILTNKAQLRAHQVTVVRKLQAKRKQEVRLLLLKKVDAMTSVITLPTAHRSQSTQHTEFKDYGNEYRYQSFKKRLVLHQPSQARRRPHTSLQTKPEPILTSAPPASE
jgi:hypothetical protein